jgi:hypothetical protein
LCYNWLILQLLGLIHFILPLKLFHKFSSRKIDSISFLLHHCIFIISPLLKVINYWKVGCHCKVHCLKWHDPFLSTDSISPLECFPLFQSNPPRDQSFPARFHVSGCGRPHHSVNYEKTTLLVPYTNHQSLPLEMHLLLHVIWRCNA